METRTLPVRGMHCAACVGKVERALKSVDGVADARVNARFKALKPADVERVKTNISDQVCEATGGPCSYLGKDMKAAHKGMRITEAEWTAGVEDLGKALDKRKVSQKDKTELLGLLAPMKNDIVNQ